MEAKTNTNPADYEIGVVVARFQVHKLHDGQRNLLDMVYKNHKKVIIFLGISVIPGTKNNPLDFASRKAMIQEAYPKAVVLPLKDNRSDTKWSQILDAEIKIPYGDLSAVLYGSRDSFIPYYSGKNPVIEYTTDVFYSGTEVRKEVSREILASEDFRAGIIHATYAARPVTYPTVDITVYNEKGQILMAKKPNEQSYRFVGGFVDRTDESWEQAAKREFREETGGNAVIEDLIYVTSGAVKDWRYAKTESGIMTTLFIGKFLWGRIEPSDDIASLHWINPFDVELKEIMPEHQSLFESLIRFLHKTELITKNTGSGKIEEAKKKFGESVA
jgi:bifunctional NMN adenylyltransferase/nudix hydrolase